MRRDTRSAEAGLKYFILGALASGILLYGVALLYGFSGTTNFDGIAQVFRQATPHDVQVGRLMGLIFVLSGLFFKASIVPFHMWTPDVYEGAPTSVTALMSAGVKAAAFAAFLRVFLQALPALATEWQPAVAVLAIVTMVIGNLGALAQTNVKRMLAYSSVAHAGYILTAVVAVTARWSEPLEPYRRGGLIVSAVLLAPLIVILSLAWSTAPDTNVVQLLVESLRLGAVVGEQQLDVVVLETLDEGDSRVLRRLVDRARRIGLPSIHRLDDLLVGEVAHAQTRGSTASPVRYQLEGMSTSVDTATAAQLSGAFRGAAGRALPAVVPAGAREPHVAPFIEAAAMESAATARRDDAKVFLREFTRELVREINASTKFVVLAIALVLVGGMLYLGFAMFKEIQRSRRLIDEQRVQLGQMREQVSKTNDQLTGITESTKLLQDSLSLAVKLRSEYGSGVCLIAGSYYFVEAGTGRPLRFAESQINESGVAVQSGTAPESLTPEGNAAIAEYEFVGTGFHVGQGFVVTNRHIAQPWVADDRAQSISGSLKAQPRLRRLIAYFPNFAQAIPLKFKAAAQRDDLAVCSLEMTEVPPTIPVLPLETDPDAVAVGKTVVMMGYPSGPDRLLALLDDAESRGIQQRYGTPMAQLAYLAETKRIQPLTTQGSITDLDVRRIVYDARTAEGGSGAPLFGPSGRVIGVNFAVFTENQASNFAVPTRFAISLLERTGWTAPPKDGKEVDTASQPSSYVP